MSQQEIASSRVLFSVREGGNIIGRSRSFIYDEIRAGRLATLKHAGRRRVHRIDLDRYVDQVRAQATGTGAAP